MVLFELDHVNQFAEWKGLMSVKRYRVESLLSYEVGKLPLWLLFVCIIHLMLNCVFCLLRLARIAMRHVHESHSSKYVWVKKGELMFFICFNMNGLSMLYVSLVWIWGRSFNVGLYVSLVWIWGGSFNVGFVTAGGPFSGN